MIAHAPGGHGLKHETRDPIPPFVDAPAPTGSVPLREFRAAFLARAMGYFQKGRFVVIGYCPGGGEVVWKDGKSSGFGTGGWRSFLEEIAPLARRHGIDLGGVNRVGTHVLWIDRTCDAVFAAPRQAAELTLAQYTGALPSTRPCLCAAPPCSACPCDIARQPRRGPAG